ncbi:enoyl-CoA hydratase/isomerase family protein [Rhodococcus koreensis]
MTNGLIVQDEEHTAFVHMHVDGPVATIRLSSPRNRNALSRKLRRELKSCLATALAQSEIRAIILTHAGKVFCSGADLDEVRSDTADGPNDPSLGDLVLTLWHSPKPVIAVLRGPARAGGIGLAAACDIVLAAESATFAFTEVRIGVIPALISAPLIERVPRTSLHELFLTGETFSADTASTIGLVNATADVESLDELAHSYLESILQGAPKALAGAKLLTRPAAQMTSEQLAELESLSQRFFDGVEAAEGVQAFLDKRPPKWRPDTLRS